MMANRDGRDVSFAFSKAVNWAKRGQARVPLHKPLKTGTLHGILSETAQMRSITIESIAELL